MREFQEFIRAVYSLPDDRLYSIWDILTQQQRFTMRALKGIRKGNKEKLKTNLLIAFSWLMAIANRFHIDVEEEIWKRFPGKCSYCGVRPCACKKIKPTRRKRVTGNMRERPNTLAESQKLIGMIYPPERRTLAEAGAHLAEEMGEASEAIHNFLGQHVMRQFDEVKSEIADYVSCVFGVANSARIPLAQELAHMYTNNCHIFHKLPCACGFSKVAQLKT